MRNESIKMIFWAFFLVVGLSLTTDHAYAEDLNLDESTFPDQYFREYLAEYYDKDESGILEEEEVAAVTEIWFNSEGTCSSLEGIQYMQNLEVIVLRNGSSEYMDVSGKDRLSWVLLENFKIKECDFSGCTRMTKCKLGQVDAEKLDLSGCESLEQLSVISALMTELEITDCVNLKELVFNNGILSKIQLDHPRLRYLELRNNQLTEIDLSKVPNLQICDVNGNQLEHLDVSKCPLIERIECKRNRLKYLECNDSIYLRCIWCNDNEIERLDITGCKALADLECRGNHLKALDLSGFASLYPDYLNLSPQTVQLEGNAEGNVDFSQIEGLDPEQILWVKGGELIENVFYPDPKATEYSYNYNPGYRYMVVEFTIASHEAPHEHSFDEGHIIRQPTCLEEGLIEYCCTECDKKKTEIINKVEHEYHLLVTKASFSKNGKVEEICKFCNYVKETTPISAIRKVQLLQGQLVYEGKEKKPQIVIVDKKGSKLPEYFYTVKYKNKPIKVGKYIARVRLTGLYRGEKSVPFVIVPEGTQITALTPGNKSFSVAWKKKTTQTDGYEIQYSTNKRFTQNATKTVRVKKNTITNKIVKNLKPRQKLYVRIRTYKKVGGRRYFSCWSDARKVITK